LLVAQPRVGASSKNIFSYTAEFKSAGPRFESGSGSQDTQGRLSGWPFEFLGAIGGRIVRGSAIRLSR